MRTAILSPGAVVSAGRRNTIMDLRDIRISMDRKTGAEVLMIDMLDEYGFDFPYIPPSDMSAAEKARVEKLYADRGIAFGTPIMDING